MPRRSKLKLSTARRWAVLFVLAFACTQLGLWFRRSALPVAGSVTSGSGEARRAAASEDAEPLDWRSERCPAASEEPTYLGERLRKRQTEGRPPCEAGDLMTVVLPLTVGDLPRFGILDRSFARFFDMGGVCELLVVAIDAEAEAVAEAVAAASLAPHARVLRERQLVPELAAWDVPHWIRQQILKLSLAAHVRTKFYLTLDADVIAVKRCGPADLLDAGRGRTNMRHKERLSATVHSWFNGSAKVLGLEIPAEQPMRFGVTPALLSTSVTRGVGRHVEARFGVCWRKHLVDRVWDSFTEYGVYFTFAAASGLFPKYHVETPHGVYKEWALGMWWPNMLDTWDLKRVFDPREPGCFTVAQSNTKIPAERFWEKARPPAPPRPPRPSRSRPACAQVRPYIEGT